MPINRRQRRKDHASTRKKGERNNLDASKPLIKNKVNPIETLKFLEKVQSGAPIDFHLSTMYSDTKVGDIDFLPLYFKCMEDTGTTAPSWKVFRRLQRALVLAQYFDYSLSIPGNKVECGVFRGFSALLTNLIAKMRDKNWTGRGFHLVDSYEGLSQPEIHDAIGFKSEQNGTNTPLISHQSGAFATPIEDVKLKLNEFEELSFHKGWIPKVFDSLPKEKWSFVHIDVDLYRPTFDTLEFFYPKMALGGVIINDDYDSPLFPGGGSGWADFFQQQNRPFIVLDTGQAIYINN